MPGLLSPGGDWSLSMNALAQRAGQPLQGYCQRSQFLPFPTCLLACCSRASRVPHTGLGSASPAPVLSQSGRSYCQVFGTACVHGGGQCPCRWALLCCLWGPRLSPTSEGKGSRGLGSAAKHLSVSQCRLKPGFLDEIILCLLVVSVGCNLKKKVSVAFLVCL